MIHFSNTFGDRPKQPPPLKSKYRVKPSVEGGGGAVTDIWTNKNLIGIKKLIYYESRALTVEYIF